MPGIAALIILLVSIFLYFLPTVVAHQRHISARNSVTVINIFLGWTMIGWVVALAMAVSGAPTH